MKAKIGILVITLLIFILSAAGCSIPDKYPEQTTLDFWILQEVASQDWSGYTEIPGWMGAREYYGKLYRPSIDENGNTIYPEECVKYLISAWPDYADGGQYVTRITITDPNVQFFGLTVESTIEQFDEVLTKNGLQHETRVDELDQAAEYKESWNNMSYSITLTRRNGKCLVVIDAPVSNRDNIVF